MNASTSFRTGTRRFRLVTQVAGCLVGLVLASTARSHAGNAMAERGFALPPERYSFAMQLPAGTVCEVEAQVTKTGDSTPAPAPKNSPDADITPVHEVRLFGSTMAQMTCTYQSGKQVVYYSNDGWTLFNDPRMGLNIRRAGDIYPDYHTYAFPELTWATPDLRQILPAKPGSTTPPVERYNMPDKAGNFVDVDSSTHRPIQFVNGTTTFIYTYRTSSEEIQLPPALAEAFAQGPGAHE